MAFPDQGKEVVDKGVIRDLTWDNATNQANWRGRPAILVLDSCTKSRDGDYFCEGRILDVNRQIIVDVKWEE